MSTAQRRGMFFGTTVRVGDSLPVIVKDKKTGKVDEKETKRINVNNYLFKRAQEDNTFSIGKLQNAITKLLSRKVGTGEQASVINTAEKVSKVDRARLKERDGFASGGSVKKYARGGGVRKANYK
tara:strand:+ start:55 stop:429 length:375 start_codon:yes stop_codon:yes gene_type:complete